MMHGQGKSDGPIVPGKPSNKPVATGAEGVEGRGPAKGNPQERTMLRTQGRARMQQALERVRQAAKQDRKMRFTALLHHVYDPDTLREAYYGLKREAAPGVDGVTWQDYGGQLEANLQDLSGRLKRGAYRARPTRRAYIDKADGRKRPLGVMALEDKIVQRATVEVLNAIYEVDFLGFSYGFRPGRSPHKALDALYVAQLTRKVNWVLDADIRGFFDAIDREWLVKFIEHRIGDRRIVRLIQKWLNAGVLEEGKRTCSETGTVQGGSISPLLANVYLHYVFDLWVQQWRNTQARGEVIVVRYADDFIVGFQHRRGGRAVPGRFAGALCQVRAGVAPGEDPADRVRPVGGRKPPPQRPGQTADLQLPRLHAHLRQKAQQRLLHGVSADHAQAVAGEAGRGQGRVAPPHVPARAGCRQLAVHGAHGALPLLRGAHERRGAGAVPIPAGVAVASQPVATKPERPDACGNAWPA